MKVLQVLGGVLVAVSLLALGVAIFFAVLFKDGLGPDSVETSGLVGLVRILEGGAPAAFLAIPLAVGSIMLGISARRSKHGVTKAGE